MVERLLLKTEEAAEALGIARSEVYVLMSTGQLESLKIGRKRRIPVDALRAYVDTQRAASPISAAV